MTPSGMVAALRRGMAAGGGERRSGRPVGRDFCPVRIGGSLPGAAAGLGDRSRGPTETVSCICGKQGRFHLKTAAGAMGFPLEDARSLAFDPSGGGPAGTGKTEYLAGYGNAYRLGSVPGGAGYVRRADA